jgi:hypothetical protein
VNENVKATSNVGHHESLQNLQRLTRPMLSRPLNIEHNNQNQAPARTQNAKRTAATAILVSTQNLPNTLINHERKPVVQSDHVKRSVTQDDIENIQERLNEMLIVAPATNNHSSNDTLLLPAEQVSTTEYFTPKVSIDDNGKKKPDEHDSQLLGEESVTDNNDEDDDADEESDLYRKHRRSTFSL